MEKTKKLKKTIKKNNMLRLLAGPFTSPRPLEFVFSAFFGFQYKQYKSLTTHNIPKIMQNYRTSSEEKNLSDREMSVEPPFYQRPWFFRVFFVFCFCSTFFVFSVRPCRLSKDISQQFCISPSILKPLHRFKVCFQSYILLYMPCAAVSFK